MAEESSGLAHDFPEHEWSHEWIVEKPHEFFSNTLQDVVTQYDDNAPGKMPYETAMEIRRLFILAGGSGLVVKITASGRIGAGEAVSEIRIATVKPMPRHDDQH